MPTIKQVAELAGVSFKTVSRVINGDKSVRPETRELVNAAIKQLGYRPHMSARVMRTRRSQVIGLITDLIATTPFAVDVVRGAETMAWKYERMLLVINTEGDPEMDRKSVEMMLSHRVEGIIFAAMFHREVTVPETIHEVPSILVNCYTSDRSLPSVVPDEYDGGFRATEILIQHGHERIALMNLPEESVAAKGRLKGYQDALEKYGLTFHPEWVRPGLVRTPEGEVNRAYVETRKLLEESKPPTAFFCANDRIAMHVYDAIKRSGLSIPDDIAVMGYDNQKIIAANLHPGLSTMALPHQAMGQWAVEQLMNASINVDAPVQHKIQCTYVERESV